MPIESGHAPKDKKLLLPSFAHCRSELTGRRCMLKATGFSPIPLNGKAPKMPDWQTLLDVPPEQIASWEKARPRESNTGILTKYTPTLDIDLLNRKAAVAVERLVHERFAQRGVVLVRIGRPPKRAIPFRTDAPFPKISVGLFPPHARTRWGKHPKHNTPYPIPPIPEKLEFLGDGQQLVCFGIHPDTERPYRWHGEELCEPGEVRHDQLPLITEAEARQLIEDIAELLVTRFGYKRKEKKRKEKEQPSSKHNDDGERVDWSEAVGRIIAGEGLHDNLRDLGASLVGSGVSPGAAKGVLRAVMNSSTAPRNARWHERYDDIGRLVESAQEKFDAVGELFDPWAQYVMPAFPLDVLPPVAQDFVAAQSTVIGCDPSALAMAVLAAFSGALDHRLELKMMRHGSWYERPRLWVLLVGDPSTKKTPIFDTATAPLERYQNFLQQDYQRKLRAYERAKNNGDDVDKPIPPARYVVWDTTTEKLGELLARYDKGLLVKRDEIAGWVGSMEKYASGRGAGTDRAFWLKAYDGGGYAYDRISRGELFINNLSVSLLGGIQPKRLAELRGLTSDGLLQRFLPVLMRPATLALDRAGSDEAYRGLVRSLIRVRPARLGMTDAALELMDGLRGHLHELALASGGLADGFQSFVGKLAGYSGSLALVLHMASDPRDGAESPVERATVEKVRQLVVDFILPHAFEFYRSHEGMTDGDRLQRLASFVLTSGLQRVKTRDLTRGVASLRGLTLWELNQQVSTLVVAGWLKPVGTGPLYGAWWVNPAVAAQFAERRREEELRKRRVAELMGSPRKVRPEG
jgi:Protein of unknown function (DUF3987)/Bifunctional DNA primase/polymerase, N-terminal